MKELIGKKINGIMVSDDESLIVFGTDHGNFCYKTEGDCCSETWFADFVGVEVILDQIIEDVEEVPQEDWGEDDRDGRGRQECEIVYGYKFKTAKGVADLIYRNSSNGYYGGECGLVDSNILESADCPTFISITADWSA
jgi:hypothetical protein